MNQNTRARSICSVRSIDCPVDKVKFYKTPNSVLAEQLKVWDGIVEKKSGENPMFKRVIDSQRKFAERATKWQNDTNIDFKIAAAHYFAKKA